MELKEDKKPQNPIQDNLENYRKLLSLGKNPLPLATFNPTSRAFCYLVYFKLFESMLVYLDLEILWRLAPLWAMRSEF